MYLQETGSLQALHPHTSVREGLASFLCFVVLEGEGTLTYDGKEYSLAKGDCVFIDCRKSYRHATGFGNDALWSLRWCHFYSASMHTIYEKYRERGGQPVFHPASAEGITALLADLYQIASTSDYIRDMRINEKLSSLLMLLMEESWHPEFSARGRKRMEIVAVKEYLDEHYTEKLSLEELSRRFFINKYYMVKLFTEAYGTTIRAYVNALRVTKAKQLLRFSDMRMEEIGCEVGFEDPNYFSRMFKKVEGMSPSEYRKLW
ncbi:MAG: helix-turn-helix domain-containing protein [Agathobacter sp.]